jgi:hypothetical protein
MRIKHIWLPAISVLFLLAPLSAPSAGGEGNWQTYRNEKQGYHILYPGGWEAREVKPRVGNRAGWEGNILLGGEIQKVTFLEQTARMWNGEFRVRVVENPKGLGLDEWIEKNTPRDIEGGSLIQGTSKTVLDGQPASRLSIFGFDREVINVVALRDGRVFELSYTGENPNDPDLKAHNAVYEKMLSSFAFK